MIKRTKYNEKPKIQKVANQIILIFFIFGISISFLLYISSDNTHELTRLKHQELEYLNKLSNIVPTQVNKSINLPIIKEYKKSYKSFHPEVEVIESE